MRAGRYLIALAGVGVLAAGCGTVHAGRTSSGTPDTLMSAVSHTAAQSARITITEAIRYAGMSLSYTQTGEFDFAHSRGMITMAAPVDVTELFLPPKLYVKFSDGGPTLPHGKTWAVIDTGTSGSSADSLAPFGAESDPADMLASLEAIAGSERILGTARVRGVPTTEYQVNIDPAKLAAKVPASERASVRQFIQSLGKGTVPVDVWVDSQNEVRQVRVSLHMSEGGALPENARLTETLDFYDFGVAVRVSAPPASQVTNLGATGDVSVGAVASGSAEASAAPLPPALPTAASASAPAPPAVSASAPAVSASPFPAQG